MGTLVQVAPSPQLARRFVVGNGRTRAVEPTRRGGARPPPDEPAPATRLLRLLAEGAPKRTGWVVPELSIRFGEKGARLAARRRCRGPAWLALASRR